MADNPKPAFQATARRGRPQRFVDVIGQEHITSVLQGALERGKVSHAYLFSGPRGVGKTSSARILAKALNCVNGPTADPCGVCSNCVEIARGASLDVIEIDGASNTSVNDVRQIKDEVLFAPNSSKYKVYIIDEVHMLSNSAFNALLKTIEEPPPYVVFAFATTEIHKVPATIKSRCQQFHFRLIDVEIIKARLQEAAADLGIQVETEALYWIAKEATGSLRDAYTLFDQVAAFSDGEISLEKIRDKLGLVGLDSLNELGEALAQGHAAQVLELTQNILSAGVAVEQYIMDLAEYFRSLLFLKHGIRRESLLGYSPERFSTKVLDSYAAEHLERALEMLLSLYRNIRYSLNQRYELDLLLSRLSVLTSLISSRELVQRVEGLKQDLFNISWSGDEKKKSLNHQD